MVIADLDYLESAPDACVDMLSGSAGAFVGVWGFTEGKFTITRAKTLTFAWQFSNGGSLAIGLGGILAIAYTPPHS